MRHHIIVKYNEEVADKAAMLELIRALFETAESIPGVQGFEFHRNCVDRPNRYDLMIVVNMEAQALPAWDASALHGRWKTEFGQYLAAKAIFDCE